MKRLKVLQVAFIGTIPAPRSNHRIQDMWIGVKAVPSRSKIYAI